jgi:hypothetical protein
MLVLNKINIVLGHLFNTINRKLNALRGYYNTKNIYFRHIPIVIILSNFI